jgi:hypothetical protein
MLDSFHIDKGDIKLLQAKVQNFVVPVVSCRANHVTCNAVLSSFAEADVANFFKGTSGLNKHFYDLDLAGTSRLDDERRLSVSVVHIRTRMDRTHSLRRLPNIYSILEQ